MQYEIRKSNAGIVLWGDIYELKMLWTFIHRVSEESRLLDGEHPLTWMAYEVRHAFDRMRRKDTRKWCGEDATPIYGFDCIWPITLVQIGLLRAGLSFMPTVTRQDQTIMYGIEYVILDALEQLYPGMGEQYLKSAVMIAHQGTEIISEKIHSRVCYFLTLTPKKRKDRLGSIVDSLGSSWAVNNPLTPDLLDPFDDLDEYPDFKW